MNPILITILCIAAALVTATLFVPGFPLREKLRGLTTGLFNILVVALPPLAGAIVQFAGIADLTPYLDGKWLMIWIAVVGIANVIKNHNKVDRKLLAENGLTVNRKGEPV